MEENNGIRNDSIISETKPESVYEDVQTVLRNEVSGEFASVENAIDKEGQSIASLAKKSYNTMDMSFQEYLNTFNRYTKISESQKVILKPVFFAIVMAALIFVIVSSYILLFYHDDLITDTTIISTTITSSVETVSAIVVLPKIIVKYLFDKDEDANKTNIIKGSRITMLVKRMILLRKMIPTIEALWFTEM